MPGRGGGKLRSRGDGRIAIHEFALGEEPDDDKPFLRLFPLWMVAWARERETLTVEQFRDLLACDNFRYGFKGARRRARQIGSECLVMPDTFPGQPAVRRLGCSGRGSWVPWRTNDPLQSGCLGQCVIWLVRRHQN
jgi:hypothetical protein